jgi:hypothetical protein
MDGVSVLRDVWVQLQLQLHSDIRCINHSVDTPDDGKEMMPKHVV